MPEITVRYDNVILFEDGLSAWNDPDTSLTDWWDAGEKWVNPAKGDKEFFGTRFSPKALSKETLTQWWDAIGRLWYKIAHDYPRRG